MAEHVHGCLACRPDMVPDFDQADPRFHDRSGGRCASSFRVLVDGSEVAYTHGAFEAREGWALFAGATADAVHRCPCGSGDVCVEPRFGTVAIEHEGPCR